ncbi:hypothetical protein L6164_012921 [Bauhinia variegata]|uniref:Uncharacterized protein n=1 Tax=Bauhinia variegata TaxID=167791 RepID=A0ACB9PD42_BAUVA|nr:hypothetical protein L6164_012921 [Bauhinia variegata]
MEVQVLPLEAAKEDEINIYVRVMKTTQTRAKKSQTVSNLKEIIRNQCGITEHYKHLFFSGEKLRETQTLDQCGIKNDSTIDMVIDSDERMKIYVKYLSMPRTIFLEPKITDTIKKIKTMVQTLEKLEPDMCCLIYKGKMLKDESSLTSLQVPSGSTLYLVPTPKEDITLFVKEQNGDTTKLEVKATFTVQDVKAVIGSMKEIEESEWRLAFAGNQLEEHRSLAYYGIMEGSVLDIYPRKFQVFVRTWNGKTITLHVDQDQDVLVLKLDFVQKMKRLMKVPRYTRPVKLVYGGKELENGEKLSSYNIQRDSTIREH